MGDSWARRAALRVVEQGEQSVGAVRARMDGWVNLLTGLGSTLRDKGTASEFVREAPLSPEDADALFHGDDLANRIVSAVPDDALRQGFRVKRTTEEETGEDAGVGEVQEAVVAMEKRLRELDVAAKVHEAMIWGRCFGGAAILLLVEGGGTPETPLVDTQVKRLVGLTVLDRRDLTPATYYGNPLETKYGQVETYYINPIGSGGRPPVDTRNMLRVHETRLVLFRGAMTSRRERERNQGWDHSVLQRVVHILRGANTSWDSVVHMMNDFSQAVFKIQGLIDAIAEGDADKLTKRMALVDMVRSVARAIVVDADAEDFQVVERGALTGLQGVLEQVWLRLAAAARMPVTILMGQAPAGLNATGAIDLRWWYDTVRTAQEQEIRPRLERIVRLVARELFPDMDPDAWEVEFPSLWQMTPEEEAALRDKVADTDVKYINAGVVLPEEITLSRFGRGIYSTDYVVDLEARKRVLEAELDRMEEGTQDQMEEGTQEPPAPPAGQLPPPPPLGGQAPPEEAPGGAPA